MGPCYLGYKGHVIIHPWMEHSLSQARSQLLPHIVPGSISRVFWKVFCVLNIVANKGYGVFTRKLTYFYFLASEKHFEGLFNLYICCMSLKIHSHHFAYTGSRKSEGSYEMSIVDAGILTPLDEGRKNLYNKIGFKNINQMLCTWSKNVRNMIKTWTARIDIVYNHRILVHACSPGVSVLARGLVHWLLQPTVCNEQSGLGYWRIHHLWKTVWLPESLGYQR